MNKTNFIKERFVDSKLSDSVMLIADVAVSTVSTGLPIVSVLKSLYDSIHEMKEKVFYQKVFYFLNEVKDIAIEERKDFNSEIEKKGEDFWNQMLLIIHDLDNTNKATIVGALLKNVVSDNITYEEFKRLIYVVETLYYDDLIFFIENYSSWEINWEYAKYLNVGLMDERVTLSYSDDYNQSQALGLPNNPERPHRKVDYVVNDLGIKLVKYGS